MDEEIGIYRGEVIEIMGALADLKVDLAEVLSYLRDEDDDDETEEEEPLL